MNPQPNPPPQDPDGKQPDQYQLRIVGNTSVVLQKGQQISLQVVYSMNGKGIGGQAVFITPKGAYADSRLSTYKVVTDAYGFAETVVIAGQMLTSFTVEASAEQDGPVVWSVQVVEAPEPPPPPTLTLDGTFTVTSNYNIKTDFVGSKLAQVLNVLDKISDDPQDPGKFVVDTVLSKIDNQAVSTVATLLKPTLYQEVNKVLANVAPQLVADFMQLSQDISLIARHFELISVMVSATPQLGDKPMFVNHKLTKIAWTLGSVRDEYAFSSPPEAKNVQLTLGINGDLVVAEHSFDFKYGVFLLAAINNLVIPALVPGAYDIESLLKTRIDCQKVAQTMNTTVGIGGEALWKTACDTGLAAVALLIEDEIAKLDSENSTLTINGSGKLLDTDKNGVLDAMTAGVWVGDLQLGTCIAPLAGTGNTFYGQLKTAP